MILPHMTGADVAERLAVIQRTGFGSTATATYCTAETGADGAVIMSTDPNQAELF